MHLNFSKFSPISIAMSPKTGSFSYFLNVTHFEAMADDGESYFDFISN